MPAAIKQCSNSGASKLIMHFNDQLRCIIYAQFHVVMISWLYMYKYHLHIMQSIYFNIAASYPNIKRSMHKFVHIRPIIYVGLRAYWIVQQRLRNMALQKFRNYNQFYLCYSTVKKFESECDPCYIIWIVFLTTQNCSLYIVHVGL